MSRLLPLLLLSSLLSPAFAQPAPAAGGGLPAMVDALQASEGLPKRAALESITLQRWPGGAETTITLEVGDEVEIVARGDGGLVRVRKGTDFGWVAEAKLGPVAAAEN